MKCVKTVYKWYDLIIKICERIYNIRSLTDEAEAAKELQILFRKLDYCVGEAFIQSFFRLYNFEQLTSIYQSSGDTVPVDSINSFDFFLWSLREFSRIKYRFYLLAAFVNASDSDLFP